MGLRLLASSQEVTEGVGTSTDDDGRLHQEHGMGLIAVMLLTL